MNIDENLVHALTRQRMGRRQGNVRSALAAPTPNVTTGAASARMPTIARPRAAAASQQSFQPRPIMQGAAPDVGSMSQARMPTSRPPTPSPVTIDLPTAHEIAEQRKSVARGLAASPQRDPLAVVPPSMQGIEPMNGPGAREARRAQRVGVESFIGAARTGEQDVLTDLKDRLHRWLAGGGRR